MITLTEPCYDSKKVVFIADSVVKLSIILKGDKILASQTRALN